MTITMLYKHPGPHKIHGNMFDYIVTEDIEAAVKDGWSRTTPEALDCVSNAPPTRDEVKTKADKLGIEYKKNVKTIVLQKMVEEEIDKLEG